MIVGIDEVGRGCWAGPLVVGAVMLGGAEIDGLTDSKKLTAARREELALEVRKNAHAIGLGWVSPKLIDKNGLSWALKAASRAAIAQINEPYEEVIIDGTIRFLNDKRATTLKKADLLVPSVSAASIVAKVARDRYMKKMSLVFQKYGFGSHVGYGTAAHRRALSELGPTPIHRMSYAPLEIQAVAEAKTDKVSQTSGRKAEQAAARFLEAEGFYVVAQNWRSRYCEVDIIAEKDGVLHFVEVKYRRGAATGDGLAAITATKLRQMHKAAEIWCHHNNATSSNRQLSVIALEGLPMQVVHWLPNIT